MRPEIQALQEAMEGEGYIADPAIATALYLAQEMRRPLLVEGDAGVGKTEIAKVLARLLGTELIRLQCYEGLDVSTSLYEWNYQRQMLRLRLAEREGKSAGEIEELIFGRGYLLERPLLLERLVPRLATRPSRRRVPVRGRGEPDLRRSFRRAAAQGGEFLSLARRARAVEEPRLVVLCDTSGSMDPHSRFLLTFILALRRVAGWGRACEIFAFNTALVRLTPLLRTVKTVRTVRTAPTVGASPRVPGASFAAPDPVLERLAAAVPDWSGGTRIGECLAEFAAHHLDQRVDANTVVLILSDGLDRGDVEPLAWAMRAIRARARRVLWLNPLAGDARYEPTARAMAAALPHIDRLLPAHNLESLERLLPLLSA